MPEDKNQESIEPVKSSGNRLGVFISVLVVVVWFLSWFLIDKFVMSTNVTLATNEGARGVFGDKFGAVNSIFSGLAFTGIIWTLILQRRDLSLQRREIERQNENLRRQSFESTLFQMLSLHTSIVEKLDVRTHRGRKAFEFFIDLLKVCSPELRIFHALRKLSEMEVLQIRTQGTISEEAMSKLDSYEQAALKADIADGFVIISKSDIKDKSYHEGVINSAYIMAHEKSQNGLSHYFRNLYHIFKLIDDSAMSEQDKGRYAGIVRAQLSDDELVALFYNCVAIVDDRSELGKH